MIGTQIGNNPLLAAYYCILLAVMAAFAVYDLCKRRVPNKALAFSLPIFLAAPILSAWNGGDLNIKAVTDQITGSFLGALTGFGILLCAALLSKGGCGVGGGDIKLAGLIGFALGPYKTLGMLLAASALCIPAALFCRMQKNKVPLSLPFVPFLFLGYCLVFAVQIIS